MQNIPNVAKIPVISSFAYHVSRSVRKATAHAVVSPCCVRRVLDVVRDSKRHQRRENAGLTCIRVSYHPITSGYNHTNYFNFSHSLAGKSKMIGFTSIMLFLFAISNLVSPKIHLFHGLHAAFTSSKFLGIMI